MTRFFPHAVFLILGILLGAGLTLVFFPGDHPASSGPSPSASAIPSVLSPAPTSRTSRPAAPLPFRPAAPSELPDLTPDELSQALASLMASPQPLLRAAELTQLGYRAATADLNHAVTQIDAIADAAGKRAFLRGVFTRIAEDTPPYEALQRLKGLTRQWETEGFKALVAQWTGEEPLGDPSFDDLYRQVLGRHQVTPEIKEAWLKAYQDHPARSSMAAEVAASQIASNPTKALALGDHFEGWERQQFYQNLAKNWMQGDPGAAWDWISRNPGLLDPQASADALASWSRHDPSAAQAAFDRLTDPQARLQAAAALAQAKATSGRTEDALAWADNLPSSTEQDAAHAAIYDATPRGIGAVLHDDQGALTIRDIMPDTPAASAGLRPGDRLVEVDPGDGQFHSLAGGTALQEAVTLLRGEAGSPLRVRVLRNNGTTEVIDLQRQQLILGRESRPAPIPAP